ncbi:MAG: MBL fold metallo-hydrolase [Methanoregulaceae archaeon]|nr:MBL fold metallo-hydrolase [Methanoregulaceae archaeon]
MRCTVLASGSKGNCICIQGENGAVLVDAGLSVRETLARLSAAGCNPSSIEAILVTHEHTDHVRGLGPLARRLGVPVYGTAGTLRDLNPANRVTCRMHETYHSGDFTIEPFPTSHDAREPCGYRIRTGDLSIACCTDTGIITDRMLPIFRSCEAVVIESNHCPDMLMRGPYPAYLKKRILSSRGHLSNQDAARCLQSIGTEVQAVILAHLSEVNNTPDLARSVSEGGLGLCKYDLKLAVALQVTEGIDRMVTIDL